MVSTLDFCSNDPS